APLKSLLRHHDNRMGVAAMPLLHVPREAADSGCSCARLSQREGQAEGDLGDVGAGQVEGHPHAVAEESQDEIPDEAVRLGAPSDALYDAGREAGCAARSWCADEG